MASKKAELEQAIIAALDEEFAQLDTTVAEVVIRVITSHVKDRCRTRLADIDLLIDASMSRRFDEADKIIQEQIGTLPPIKISAEAKAQYKRTYREAIRDNVESYIYSDAREVAAKQVEELFKEIFNKES